jgi:flagellar assembly factor FliW
MQIETYRFGRLEIESADLIHFPRGILGMENCRQWVLLADNQNEALGWLQSAERPEVALAVVSPRRFVPDYQIRLSRREIDPLAIERIEDAQVLVIVGRAERSLSLNLKAPLVFNLARRLGAQVVAKDEHAIQYELSAPPEPLKKSA